MSFILRDEARVSVRLGSHPARVTEGRDAIVEVARDAADGALTGHLAVATEGRLLRRVRTHRDTAVRLRQASRA